MSTYEFWLCDEYGTRITLLDVSSASYSRSTRGYGTFQCGVPLKHYQEKVPYLFKRDWRMDVWRSPSVDYPLRRECSFFLRQMRIYQREDGMDMVELYGRSPIEILRRMLVNIDDPVDLYFKTDEIDDMMKDIVRDWVGSIVDIAGVDHGLFEVDADDTAGPEVTKSFLNQIVLDVLNELRDTSLSMNSYEGSAKIYFDVVEDDSLHATGFGYRFKTYPNFRGADRSDTMIFSPENGNGKDFEYVENYLDEITHVYVIDYNDYFDWDRAGGSIWNKNCWAAVAYTPTSDIPATIEEETFAFAQQNMVLPDIRINCTFLSTPGGPVQPRSLYGVDWDFGDKVTIVYAGKVVTAEVAIVYVSINENGEENITGRTTVGE